MSKKILLCTPVFKPMVGGMETMANNLGTHFANRGYSVILATPITANDPDDAPYKIIRNPTFSQLYNLANWADLIFSNGASMFPVPAAVLTRTPTIVRHTNYVASTIDGAGWYNEKPAPLAPLASVKHHLLHGRLLDTLRGTIKLVLLRAFLKTSLVTNVAISDWMMSRHPLPNQTRIYNPFPIVKFKEAINKSGEFKFDFFFLGRLISEKGVDVLIDAFDKLRSTSSKPYKLCIIGDGPMRQHLTQQALASKYSADIVFTGTKKGVELINLVKSCRIAVLPSTWEEPFGGVSTELMAAGKNLIVSKNGALAEIVGEGGLTFENGQSTELARVMLKLVEDTQLQEDQAAIIRDRLKVFNEDDLVDDYIDLIESLTSSL